MTQEEKQELLVALCGYLPYGVKLEVKVFDKNLTSVDTIKTMQYDMFGTYVRLLDDENFSIKPYLRPMSSLTEQEISVVRTLDSNCATIGILGYDNDSNPQWAFGDYRTYTLELLNYLNSIHIDYRGIIDKGLALEAPEEMYEIFPISI